MAPNWHEQVFFGLHYDLHAGANDTVLGQELTAEHLRERLLRVKPDWIQCDCKGHAGYTSWPTEVGSPSPGIVKDALRIHRDVTKELGIKLGMHYSGVWDTRAVELHPEWGRVNADDSRDQNMTCRLSGYLDELMIPQMLELVDRYDVDGFWVDGENWASAPCWCERCQHEFRQRTGLEAVPRAADETDWDAWLAFHRDLFVEHVTTYADAVHARKPECLICSNWMYTVRQPDPIVAPVDYLSGDYSWNWGADRAAVEGRLLDGRNKTWDLMAWGFTKTGDMNEDPPWVVKGALHLCQEVAEVVALGGAVMIYNSPQRTGWLTGWHQDTFAEVAGFCRQRQEVCFGTQTASEAAVLHLADHYYSCNDPLFNLGRATDPLEGALHALLENQISTDILTAADALERMARYKLVVVPEQTHLNESVLASLNDLARAGGHVLMSGAHLTGECADLIGVSASADAGPDRCYLPVGERAVPVSGPWRPVEALTGTEVWARAMTQQEPEKGTTDQPVVTARRAGQGLIVAAHGPLFANYFKGHYPLLRLFIREVVERMNIPWSVTAQGPARLEVITRQRGDQSVINLINRGSGETLSAQRVMVEELPPVENVVVVLKRPAEPRSVRAVPDDVPLTWSHAYGETVINIPRVDTHVAIIAG